MRLGLMAIVLLAGCPGGGGVAKRPYPEITVADMLDRLAKKQASLTSFSADSTMDYWLANQRAKGEVLVMGTTGSRVRFAALSPAGGSTISEMACDGRTFVYVDYQNNCALTGPCNEGSIAQFFGIELAPDDFVHLALGTPPILAGATGTMTWDSSNGTEHLDLTSPQGKQKLVIDAKDGKLDVLESELTGADGKVKWTVANKDFTEVADDAGGKHRVPGKTSFKSPAQKQDLLVEWGGSRKVNVQLDPAKFQLQAPSGLPACGRRAPSQGAPAQRAPSPAAPGAGAPKP